MFIEAKDLHTRLDLKFNPVDHRCKSRKIFGGAKDFCPNFSKLARKIMFGHFLCKYANTFS